MTFHFSGPLLRFVDYQRSVSVPASTLGDALKILCDRHSQVRPVLHDNTGELRRTHRLFVNGRAVPHPTADLPLDDADRVEFLTAIAGG